MSKGRSKDVLKETSLRWC